MHFKIIPGGSLDIINSILFVILIITLPSSTLDVIVNPFIYRYDSFD